MVEAMSYGIPTVASSIAASGLNLRDGEETLIGKEDEDFINKVVQLYENETLWYAIQRTAQNYIRQRCSPEAMKSELAAILGLGKQVGQPKLETNLERNKNNPPLVIAR